MTMMNYLISKLLDRASRERYEFDQLPLTCAGV